MKFILRKDKNILLGNRFIYIKIVIDKNYIVLLILIMFQLSWPDLYFVSILDHMKFIIQYDFVEGRPNLIALKHKVLTIPQIKSWMDKRPNSP